LKWLDLLVGVAAVLFAVGLDSEEAAAFGELVPQPAGGRDLTWCSGAG